MLNRIRKIFVVINLLIIVCLNFLYPQKVNAKVKVNVNDEDFIDITKNSNEVSTMNISTYNSAGNIVEHIKNNTFYIKNAYSGRYLDVQGGIKANGTNVQQYEYNGTASQQWYVKYNSDGSFTFYSKLGSDYVLDIKGGDANDSVNVQIYQYNGTDSQKFKFYYRSTSTYAIASKVSNYSKGIIVDNWGCSNGSNVIQYTYDADWNRLWILEPVSMDVDMGAKYSMDNYNQHVYAYPKFSKDCTNFVSQCMIASGIHYRDNWYIYRKNGNYNTPTSNSQTSNSWTVDISGPWSLANNYKSFWVSKVSKAYKVKGADITANPSIVWNVPITQGCVVQIANVTSDNKLGDAFHSMYITGYLSNGSNSTYLCTYHANDTLSKSLLDICKSYPNNYFLFYVF